MYKSQRSFAEGQPVTYVLTCRITNQQLPPTQEPPSGHNGSFGWCGIRGHTTRNWYENNRPVITHRAADPGRTNDSAIKVLGPRGLGWNFTMFFFCSILCDLQLFSFVLFGIELLCSLLLLSLVKALQFWSNKLQHRLPCVPRVYRCSVLFVEHVLCCGRKEHLVIWCHFAVQKSEHFRVFFAVIDFIFLSVVVKKALRI